MSNMHELQQEFGLVQHTVCAHHAALRFLARVSGMQGTQPTSADLFELSSAVQLRSLFLKRKGGQAEAHHQNDGSAIGMQLA